jgi:hypothetical protein
MSGGTSCSCSERQRPLTVPAGSNDRPRQWFVLQRQCNHSAFNGYRWTRSAYSSLRCAVCGAIWRTKADYVDQLRSDATAPGANFTTVQPLED